MRRRLAALVLALAALGWSAAAREGRPIAAPGAARDTPPLAAGAAGGVEGPAASGARPARRIVGRVERVRDGDTIVVAGVALRLWGLHAPELRDPGGKAARRWMIEPAAGRVVVCDLVGGRSHDRLVAVCRTGDGDLAALLIGAGLGRDCRRFSRGRYAGLETDAGRALDLPAYCRTRPRSPPTSPLA